MANTDIDLQMQFVINETNDTKFLMGLRQGYLRLVDLIERKCDITPTTADLRKETKYRLYEQKKAAKHPTPNGTVDVT